MELIRKNTLDLRLGVGLRCIALLKYEIDAICVYYMKMTQDFYVSSRRREKNEYIIIMD